MSHFKCSRLLLIQACALLFAATGAFAQSSDRAGIGLLPLTLPPASLATPIVVDERKSLAITDQTILAQFSLQETLQAIISRSASPQLSPLTLFRQWWATQANDPSFAVRCNTLDPLAPNFSSLNEFPYACPRAEGGERQGTEPFAAQGSPNANQGYIPIGLFNRFDLAATDGSDCGEYRIIFARRSGQQSPTAGAVPRNLIIFEGVLPNPNPNRGVNGCWRVADFWANLSTVPLAARGAQIKSFYMNGLLGYSPVFHPQSYGLSTSGKGQIRSDQFLQQPWMLREFKLAYDPTARQATLMVKPVTVKVNPDISLFSGNPFTSDRVAKFQDAFVSQLSTLGINDINRFDYQIDDRFNSGQSVSQSGFSGASAVNNYLTAASSAFKSRIDNRLAKIGSPLNSTDILNRATALSCGGCHQVSNNQPLGGSIGNWPTSNGFTHVNENIIDANAQGEGPRFGISQALTDVFLPHRKNVLENFLNTRLDFPRCNVTCFDQNGAVAICLDLCDVQ